MLNIIKRNGNVVAYDESKIKNALEKAFVDIDKKVTEGDKRIIDKILDKLYVEDGDTVEKIQDSLEDLLMGCGRKDVARAYVRFRYKRELERNKNEEIIAIMKEKLDATNVINSNANVDESAFSGREKEAGTAAQKVIALEMLPEDVADAHRNMLIYQHDLEKECVGEHNCLNLDFQTLFSGDGFTTRNGGVRSPRSFSTACQLVAVAFQAQSQVQFGGVGSIHIDYDLSPYVKLSFYKHYLKGMKYIGKKNIDLINEKKKVLEENKPHINDEKFFDIHSEEYKYAVDMMEEEGLQSCQGLYHNLNTLESRPGSQLPFTSINFGRDISEEGRLVSKWLLQSSLDGIGKYHLTSIFPISIFQYKQGVNANPEDPNYDLKQLALKSLSKRIYPNWVNGDWSQAHEDPNDVDTFMSTMGCRTLISYDRHGLGYNRQGRGNNVPNTIILPKLGIEYGICLGKRDKADIEGFWNALEDTLKLCEKGLLARFAMMAKQSPKAAPFMYQNGTIKGYEECEENVYNALKHGSLAIGYTGVAEMCQALFGKNHAQDEKVCGFAESVIKRIYDFANEASERNALNFGTYASPFEGGCRTALLALRKQYGVIENVTSHEFLTNSHHCPVWEKISIYDKLKIESRFTKYATSGCITYVEMDSTFVKNTKAVEDIIDYAFKVCDIPYLAINFPIDSCLECGYQDEFNEECPQCGSQNIQQLRRVTGYLSSDYRQFNAGKQEEVKERVKHTMYTDFGGKYEN